LTLAATPTNSSKALKLSSIGFEIIKKENIQHRDPFKYQIAAPQPYKQSRHQAQ
jgi:hypothetical protein